MCNAKLAAWEHIVVSFEGNFHRFSHSDSYFVILLHSAAYGVWALATLKPLVCYPHHLNNNNVVINVGETTTDTPFVFQNSEYETIDFVCFFLSFVPLLPALCNMCVSHIDVAIQVNREMMTKNKTQEKFNVLPFQIHKFMDKEREETQKIVFSAFSTRVIQCVCITLYALDG